MVNVAIKAGHHDTDRGGHPGEFELVAPVTRALFYELARYAAVEVQCVTPARGFGIFGGGLQAAALAGANLRWRDGKPTQVLIDIHCEGNSAADAGRGNFDIYPNKFGDYDAEVRTTLGPRISRAQTALTTIPPRVVQGEAGVMPETFTGVGSVPAWRLGFFAATAFAKAYCTRMMFEIGALSAPSDYRRMMKQDFDVVTAKAMRNGLAEHYKLGTPRPYKRVKITADELNVRADSSTAAAILGKLPNGKEVDVLVPHNGWWELPAHEQFAGAWISASFVQELN